MNRQLLQSYITLIQKLLACPSGEEWILLRQNEALVTPELVQVMEQVAMQLVNQGNPKEAKFLHNLAGQIHHLFVAQTVPLRDNDDHSQAYLELIKALLDCPKGSEAELLAAHQELIDPGLVHTMQQVAAQLAAKGDSERAHYLQQWAAELNRLWLQQHDFQPVPKQDPEPKHPDDPSSIRQAIPPPIAHSQPSPIFQPPSPAPQEALEDFWAEPSAPVVPTSRDRSPTSQPSPAEPAENLPIQDLAPATLLPNRTTDEPINRHLETIATALTRLSEALTQPTQPPTDPLWYMEVLERAHTGNWVLTSTEIHKLIGVQPTCPQGSQSFQRGCWVFVKAGKIGTQTGWRVTKIDEVHN